MGDWAVEKAVTLWVGVVKKPETRSFLEIPCLVCQNQRCSGCLKEETVKVNLLQEKCILKILIVKEKKIESKGKN